MFDNQNEPDIEDDDEFEGRRVRMMRELLRKDTINQGSGYYDKNNMNSQVV